MNTHDDCICGGINVRHCPVHNEPDDIFERELEAVSSVHAMRPENFECATDDFKAGARWGYERGKAERNASFEVRVSEVAVEVSKKLTEAREEIERLNKMLQDLMPFDAYYANWEVERGLTYEELVKARAMAAELAEVLDIALMHTDIEFDISEGRAILEKYAEWKSGSREKK